MVYLFLNSVIGDTNKRIDEKTKFLHVYQDYSAMHFQHDIRKSMFPLFPTNNHNVKYCLQIQTKFLEENKKKRMSELEAAKKDLLDMLVRESQFTK